MSFDYYRILKVSRNATMEQIKASYRKLAMQYHPDMCKTGKQEAETVFKLLSQAYQVLGNAEAKTAYDRSIGNFGTDGSRNANRGGRWNPAYSVRPANQKAGPRVPITRDMFDVEMWHACHYGDGLENKAAQADIKQASTWADPENKHQQYYKKKYEREQKEKETGVKWSAETAYRPEDFGREPETPPRSTSDTYTHASNSNAQSKDGSDTNSSSAKKKPQEKPQEKPRTRYEPTFKTRTGADVMSKADFFMHEKHFSSAVSNLEKNRQDRQDRKEKEKNTTANTRTPVYGGDFVASTKKEDASSCVIS